jgi:hypothetical protein
MGMGTTAAHGDGELAGVHHKSDIGEIYLVVGPHTDLNARDAVADGEYDEVGGVDGAGDDDGADGDVVDADFAGDGAGVDRNGYGTPEKAGLVAGSGREVSLFLERFGESRGRDIRGYGDVDEGN